MIIEDDTMVLNIIKEFLIKMGHVEISCTAGTLASAKRKLTENTVDLVLIDIYLPDGNGLDFLKWVRAENINTDAIMITADQRSISLETARRYGVYDYILKPFKYERFEEAINNFMSKKNLLSSKENIHQKIADQIITDVDTSTNWQNQTYESILEYLKNNSEQYFTSSEIAKELGISRITARKYLEALELKGALEMELSYGSVGRPKNKYRYKR